MFVIDILKFVKDTDCYPNVSIAESAFACFWTLSSEHEALASDGLLMTFRGFYKIQLKLQDSLSNSKT
jgi:hypothetical protein